MSTSPWRSVRSRRRDPELAGSGRGAPGAHWVGRPGRRRRRLRAAAPRATAGRQVGALGAQRTLLLWGVRPPGTARPRTRGPPEPSAARSGGRGTETRTTGAGGRTDPSAQPGLSHRLLQRPAATPLTPARGDARGPAPAPPALLPEPRRPRPPRPRRTSGREDRGRAPRPCTRARTAPTGGPAPEPTPAAAPRPGLQGAANPPGARQGRAAPATARARPAPEPAARRAVDATAGSAAPRQQAPPEALRQAAGNGVRGRKHPNSPTSPFLSPRYARRAASRHVNGAAHARPRPTLARCPPGRAGS